MLKSTKWENLSILNGKINGDLSLPELMLLGEILKYLTFFNEKKHKVHWNWVKKLNVNWVLRDSLLRRLIDKFIMCFVLSGRVKRLFLKRKYERKNGLH